VSSQEKRLAFLEKITREGSKDPMAWYGLAMEYRALERWDDAVNAFAKLRAQSPEYVAMYLMCGQVLDGMDRKGDAREWLEAGIAAAKAKKDGHALSELETALAELG
jgi:predicted Zn-dependent protease